MLTIALYLFERCEVIFGHAYQTARRVGKLLGQRIRGSLTTIPLLRYREQRRLHLTRLASKRPEFIQNATIEIAASDRDSPAQEFARYRLTRIDNFVSPDCLRILREEAVSQVPKMKRTFIPTHKKSAALSYEQIHTSAPYCLAFYHSPEVQQWISQITGIKIRPTPDQDQSSESVLCYHEPGDHINWHYDQNFYRGRHFTVLLSLVNEGPTGLSQGTLQQQQQGGTSRDIETEPNTLVIFEGAKVRHRATAIGEKERRIMLSMTYCADPRISRLNELIRRCKDTAFFGLRALWS